MGGPKARSESTVVRIPVTLLRQLDELVELGLFENRSDAIREAVRRLLIHYRKHLLRQPKPRPEVGVR